MGYRTCAVCPSDADASWDAPPCLVFSLLDVEAAEEETGLPIC